jgi:prevent-host-death family protein
MPRLNVSKAREGFPEIVNRASQEKERTILSRRGKDLAAVVPIEDLRLSPVRRRTVWTSKSPGTPYGRQEKTSPSNKRRRN